MLDLAKKRVVVTGGAGFLGSHVVDLLRSRACAEVHAPRSRDFDLISREGAQRMYAELRPDVVFHLAARVGGIGANQKNPGAYFHDNLLMGVHVLEEGRRELPPGLRTPRIARRCARSVDEEAEDRQAGEAVVLDALTNKRIPTTWLRGLVLSLRGSRLVSEVHSPR